MPQINTDCQTALTPTVPALSALIRLRNRSEFSQQIMSARALENNPGESAGKPATFGINGQAAGWLRWGIYSRKGILILHFCLGEVGTGIAIFGWRRLIFFFAQPRIILLDYFQFLFRHMLRIKEFIARRFMSCQQLIEF